jgi:hypothetical protein
MSITFKEMQSGVDINDIPINIQHNMQESLIKFNKFRQAIGVPCIVTSGYRSLQHHMDIYRAKGVPDDRVPLKSKHLYGFALDVADPDGSKYKWVEDHPELMEEFDLYYELGTKGWIHLQAVPFGSYHEGGPRGFWP